MKFRLTKDDINKGIPEDEGRCPLARCLKRHLRTSKVHVGTDVLILYGHQFPIPIKLRRLIKRIDSRKAVSPRDFELELPTLIRPQ